MLNIHNIFQAENVIAGVLLAVKSLVREGIAQERKQTEIDCGDGEHNCAIVSKASPEKASNPGGAIVKTVLNWMRWD